MILEFKTKANTNGHKKYLCISTENNTFSRFNPWIYTSGIEIKTKDYNELIERLKTTGFEEVNKIDY